MMVEQLSVETGRKQGKSDFSANIGVSLRKFTHFASHKTVFGENAAEIREFTTKPR
jgi:hypothetical protein